MKKLKKIIFLFLLCLFLAIFCRIPITVNADTIQDGIMVAEVNEPAENPPENQSNGNSNENNAPSASPEAILVGIIALFVVFKAIFGTTSKNKTEKGKIICHYCKQSVPRDAMICPYCRKKPTDGWFTGLIDKLIFGVVAIGGVLYLIGLILGLVSGK